MKKLKRFIRPKLKIIWRFLISIFFVVILGIYDLLIINFTNEEVENIANKELPLLIAEKCLTVADENSIVAARGYIFNNGDKYYRESFNKQVVIASYNIEIVKKLGAPEKLNVLFQNNIASLNFIEQEVLDVYDRGDKALALQNLKKGHVTFMEIQKRNKELIASKDKSIQKVEQGILYYEKISKIIISLMSFLIGANCIVVAFVTFQKIKTTIYNGPW